MCARSRTLRALVTERLSAAAEEICELLERTIAEYEEELCRSKEENQRNQRLLEALGPRQGAAGDSGLICSPKNVQTQWSPEPSLKQEIPETPQVKEEPEEQSVKPEEEQLSQFTETSPKNIIITSVLSLCDVSQKRNQEFTEKGNLKIRSQTASTSSPIQTRPAEKNTETDGQTDNTSDWEPPASASAAQTETEADGDHAHQVQIQDTSPAVRDGLTAETGGRKKHECSVCKKTLTTKRNLERHSRIHTGEKPFSCSTCQRAFSNSSDLRRHDITHTGERPYSCPVCQGAFNKKHILKVHMRTHTGDRPFVCSICKKTFIIKGHLNLHMTTHTGEKPYSCTVCKKAFAHASGLKNHLRKHTGEKPYSCLVCQKAFSQKSNLKIHMKKHHK